MVSVFLVVHTYDWCGCERSKTIGIYVTEREALEAVDRLGAQEGFRSWPDGFEVSEYELGVTEWEKGFSTMGTVWVPSRSQPTVYQFAEASWVRDDTWELVFLDDPADSEYSVGDQVDCETRALDGVEGRSVVIGRASDSPKP